MVNSVLGGYTAWMWERSDPDLVTALCRVSGGA
jgi:hypothetical protein